MVAWLALALACAALTLMLAFGLIVLVAVRKAQPYLRMFSTTFAPPKRPAP